MIIGSKKIPQNLVMADGKEITTKALQDIIKTQKEKSLHSNQSIYIYLVVVTQPVQPQFPDAFHSAVTFSHS